MLNTTHCHQPLPVGASGSYTVIAKRFVPCGTPLHDRGGEWFAPEQPNPLKTYWLGIRAFGLRSSTFRRKSAADTRLVRTASANEARWSSWAMILLVLSCRGQVAPGLIENRERTRVSKNCFHFGGLALDFCAASSVTIPSKLALSRAGLSMAGVQDAPGSAPGALEAGRFRALLRDA